MKPVDPIRRATGVSPNEEGNINTPEYWDGVYRKEAADGRMDAQGYHRDYGPIHDAIVGLVPDGSDVLEVACGPGILCRKIREARPRCSVLGVDFSGFAVERNRKTDAGRGIDYRRLDLRTDLESLTGGFDVITMCEVLEHLDDPEPAVASLMGRLAPGGRFILTCPHGNEIPDPEHVRDWDHDEVFHLLAPYSSTISFVHFPPPYFHVWMLAWLVRPREVTG